MNLFSIPIRKIQKYAFCPRQYYLEVLQQVPPDLTVDLLKGEILHQRIDRKKYRSKKRKIFGISVELSDKNLGIHGVIDLVELTQDGKLVPVEFKKNSDPVNLPDWIGLASYALCLENNGYEISHLEIFSHENRKRYSKQYDQKLRKKTIQTIIEMKTASKFPKTDNRNKCLRCANRNFCWANDVNTTIKLEELP